jgi:lipopolysaccharide transport system permease protein
MATEFTIRSGTRSIFNISELWHFRELVYMMAWREIKVKYKQAFFGILWAVIQPLFVALIFYFIFKTNPPAGQKGEDYFMFVFSGMVLWTFFSSSVLNAVQQILGYSSIIKKIYFPRVFIPLSSVMIAGFDFLFGFGILMFMLIYKNGFAYLVSMNVFGIFFALMLLMFISGAVGMFLSAWVIRYRDFRYVTNFLIQILFFLSPVFYDTNRVEWSGTAMETLFKWHPVGVSMEIFRGSVTGTFVWDVKYGLVFLCNVLMFLAGLIYFRKTEEVIADII